VRDDATIIIGGGLIGLTTAWELVSRGVAVEVLEARDDVAVQTSYANGGILTASMPDPWNAPDAYKHLAASLFNPYSPMKLRLRALPSLSYWGPKFLYHSTPKRHSYATRASYLLATYSISETRKLREKLDLQYAAGTTGTLKVFRNAKAMVGPRNLAEELSTLGLEYETLDADATIEAEPQLAHVRDAIVGALRFPDDESGDAHLFCRALANLIRKNGSVIRCGTVVTALKENRGRIVGIEVCGQIQIANRVILAAGNGSVHLARTVGVTLPIKPAKGYSVTIRQHGLSDWPRLPVIDDVMHAAVVPLGERMRLAGTAEFTGFDTSIRTSRIDNLFELLDKLYPHIAARVDRRAAEPWAGLRPMSADGLPFIGPAGPDGLYLNTGHGHLGWTHAIGSAKLLTDLIQRRTPAIDPIPFRALR
jgi:D-amino-acid dehydrogenase